MTASGEKTRKIFEFLVVAVCTLTFVVTLMGMLGGFSLEGAAGKVDFVEYWAAGHQLIQHENPYDSSAILKWECSAGFPSGNPPLIMPNPPWSLPLVLPLSMVGAKSGRLLWDGLLLMSLIMSVGIVRKMHSLPKSPLHLVAYGFVPAISCLVSGQITIFILLGLVLFLRLQDMQPFLAGASLWFCMLKPHLFLPFGIVLLLWIVFTRSYRILAGGALALGIGGAVATSLDRQIWIQYSSMMRVARVDQAPMFSISTMLRQYVYPHSFLLQCLPAGLSCVWAITYFLKNRKNWGWMENGSLLLLVSVLVAPYTWFMDQAVLLVAVLHGVYVARSRILIAVLALLSALIEIEIIRGVSLLHSALSLWTTPAWLAWYLLATKRSKFVDDREGIPRVEPVLQG